MVETQTSIQHVSRPPRRAVQSKAPALVLLHGMGGDETELMPLRSNLDERLYILSLRAPIALTEGGHSWFDVHFAPDPVIDADQAEAARLGLIDFLENAVEGYNLEPSCVFLAGFSQGAIMGASVALTRPDLVAGLVMMSARILPEIGPQIAPRASLESLNVFVAHGRHDGRLPLRHAHMARDWLLKLGTKLTYREYEMGHEISSDETRDIADWLHDRLEIQYPHRT